VRGVPYDKRSVLTMAYVGSLVGSTQEVDKSTLNRTDYVRIRLAARDVTKVPEVAECSISEYLYGFFFEREVEAKEAPDKVKTTMQVGNAGQDQQKAEDGKYVDQASHKQASGGQKSNSAPSKLMISGKDGGLQGGKAAKQTKLQVILDKEECALLNCIDDRVQGLSGNEISISEENLVSDEGQGSQPSKDGSSLQVGLVKHPIDVSHGEEIRDVEKKEVLLEIIKGMHMDGGALPRELVISDKQWLPETRCSSRLEQQFISKTLTNQTGKKRAAEGNVISTHNSFPALDNECISSLASEMGINIAPDQFESINIMKDLEIARQALDKSKLVEPL
jgi:hypothetical protein